MEEMLQTNILAGEVIYIPFYQFVGVRFVKPAQLEELLPRRKELCELEIFHCSCTQSFTKF